MKHKICIALLAAMLALPLSFGLAACDDKDNGDTGNGGTQTEQPSGGNQTTTPSGGNQDAEEHVHDWGEWETVKEATCTEAGAVARTCKKDGSHRETRAIKPLGHNMTTLPAREASCAEEGYEAHVGCSRCGYSEEKYAWTPALHVIYEETGNGYEVSGLSGECAHADIALPSTYGGKPVTLIGESAFYGCSGLTSVTIPDSVTLIGYQAFYKCTGLTSVTIPDSVTSIGSSAFYWCSGLTSITIPDSVTSIGWGAFYDCDGLTSVTIGSGVTSIGNDAFSGCSGLEWFDVAEENADYSSQDGILYNKGKTEILEVPRAIKGAVTIPDSVTSIGWGAFYDCDGLTSVTIGSGVTSIGNDAFSGCSSIQSITIPDSVTEIGSSAFYNCSGLQNVTIGSGVTSIGGSAFRDCDGLESMTIGSGVTSIGWAAFRNCSGLTSITIPDSVTSIGDYAFEDCSGLESVTIPDSVTAIGEFAFYGCSGLTGELNIPDGVTSIGYYAFSDCSGLESVTIGSGVTSIGSDAFSGCSSIQSMTIPFVGDSRKTANDTYQYPFGYLFGTSSFSGASAVYQYYYGNSTSSTIGTTYYIPDSLKSVTVTGGEILYGAFYNCSGLESVTIGSGVTSIGEDAFKNCSELTGELKIPDSVTSIGYEAFYNCSGLESVTIGSGVSSIGSSAFYNCSGLTSITIPDRVALIEEETFYNCSGLTGQLKIPNSVVSINANAFYNCSGLESVTIGSGVTLIGSSVFSRCDNLERIEVAEENANYSSQDGILYNKEKTEILEVPRAIKGAVTIPSSVTSIGGLAFYNCNGLTSITILDGVTSIGSGAFSGCSSIQSMTIPFVGDSRKTANDTYQYPFGYLFGTSSFSGASAVNQYYYGNSTSSWTNTTYYIPDSLKSVTVTGGDILFGAFYNCSGLTSITIPESVTSIGNYAFYKCSGLESVTIGSGVTSIGIRAFMGCSGLTGVYITDLSAWRKIDFGDSDANPLSYAHRLYIDNAEVKTLEIPTGIKEIKPYVFSDCSGLTSVKLKNGQSPKTAAEINVN